MPLLSENVDLELLANDKNRTSKVPIRPKNFAPPRVLPSSRNPSSKAPNNEFQASTVATNFVIKY